MLDSSVEKLRHIYKVAQARVARENATDQLAMMHAIGHAVASLLDKKGAAGYKALENVLVATIDGKGNAPQDQHENVAAVVQQLLQAGARRKYVTNG